MKESEGLYRSFRFLKKALLGLAVVLIGLVLFGYFFFMRHVDAPKAWSAADRELQGDMLQYGEKVQRKAKVFMRRPSDYYRGANGILYATNDRLIFIGVDRAANSRARMRHPSYSRRNFRTTLCSTCVGLVFTSLPRTVCA